MAYRKISIKYKSGKKKAKKLKLPITISNPFNSTVLNPKINDGLTPYSSGVRCQYAGEYSCFGAGAPMIVYLYPGITAGMTVYRSNQPSYGTVGHYPNHVGFKLQSDPVKLDQELPTYLTNWRLVSQALRLSLVNNCEANDGWFEAIRIDTDQQEFANWDHVPTGVPSNAAFGVVGAQTVVPLQTSQELDQVSAPTTPPGAAINTGSQEVNLPGCRLANIPSFATHPTYTTGKLKDLHKYVFQLRPTKRQHEFGALNATANDAAFLVDYNFDAICIKIYGRSYPQPAPDGSVLTRIHAHVVANQELVFDESCVLSRYHTNTKYSEADLQAMKRANTQNIRAGYISNKR